MKPILFELTDDDESRNSMQGEEVLIIEQWENATLYFNIRRINGVICDIGYCQTDQASDDNFHESLAAHYTCRGFAPDGYLTGIFSTRQEEEKEMDYDHLAEVVGSLMIKQFKGENKQEQYRAVINTIFKEYRDRDEN